MNPKLLRFGVVSIIMATLLLLATLYKGLHQEPNHASSHLNKAAQPIQAAWISGTVSGAQAHGPTISLSEFRGKPLIVNFWASWCESCRAEAQEFESFYRAHKDTIAMLGLAVQDTAENVKSSALQLGKTYVIGLDVDGHVAMDYGVTGVPETFFINKDGVIVHKIIGPVTMQELNEAIKRYY